MISIVFLIPILRVPPLSFFVQIWPAKLTQPTAPIPLLVHRRTSPVPLAVVPCSFINVLRVLPAQLRLPFNARTVLALPMSSSVLHMLPFNTTKEIKVSSLYRTVILVNRHNALSSCLLRSFRSPLSWGLSIFLSYNILVCPVQCRMYQSSYLSNLRSCSLFYWLLRCHKESLLSYQRLHLSTWLSFVWILKDLRWETSSLSNHCEVSSEWNEMW